MRLANLSLDNLLMIRKKYFRYQREIIFCLMFTKNINLHKVHMIDYHFVDWDLSYYADLKIFLFHVGFMLL
jgi:hypothetical protein